MQIENKSGNIFTGIINRIKAFDRASKRNQRITYYLAYTAIFCFLAFVVYIWFILSNKSFIWRTDGIPGNYTGLLYYGDYLRTAIHNFFTTGSLNVPMWDFHIGYGSDILATMNFAVIGDPLNLLSVFFKGDSNEILYNSLVLLRLYLAGVAFSAFCHKMGKSRFYTLMGAFIYAFCGYAVFSSVRHPYFINPMICLPLILIGVEKILEKGKPYLLIVMVCISAISNYYFFYMLSILTVVYTVVRFLSYYKENRTKQFFKSFLKFCGSYGVGVLLSAVVFLPIVIAFMNNGRLQSGYSNNLLYYLPDYYLSFVHNFITVYITYYWTETGYTSIALLSVLLMFCIKKRNVLKLLFIVLTTFMFIPLFGYVFNGFAYICNRWEFGYSLLISYITVEMLPEFMNLDNKKKAIIAVVCALIMFSGLYYYPTLMISAVFTITVAAIMLFDRINKKRERTAGKNVYRFFILAIVLSGIIFSVAYRFALDGQNYIGEFIDSGKGIETIEKTPNIALKNVKDNDFYRVETDYTGKDYIDWTYNDSMWLKFNGTNIYSNMVNGNLSRLFKEIGGYLDKNISVYQFGGMDDRASLSAIAGVKYYTLKEGREAHIPFGFRFLTSYKGYDVYENENTLPLGFTYSNYITREDYEKMTMNQKQQAFLQGVVLDEPLDGYEKGQPVFNDVDVPFDVKCGDGISYTKGSVAVTRENAEMTLTFKGTPDSETYLVFNNLWFNGERKNAWDNPPDTEITVSSDKISKVIKCKTPKATIYYNIHGFMANMGYSEDGQACFTINFSQTGKYTFDSMEIVCNPMGNFSSQIDSLKTDNMKNVVMENNYISGEADLNSDKILFLTVPYSAGWSAEVNGENVKILKANTMFMSIPLKAGKNIIELNYATPGLKYGLIISGITLIGIIGVSLFIRIKKRNNKPEEA